MTTTMDSVAMVGGLAARLDDRPACDCFALAPSRLVAALGNLAHVVAGVADAHGSAAHPRRTAQTRVRRVACHGVPLHATAELSAHPELAHLPAEPGTWDWYDRFWRS